jgi:Tfp pilus assembly protein PilF
VLYNLYLCLQQQGKRDEAKETLAQLERVTADLRRLTELTKEVARGSRDPALRCEVGMIFLKNGQDKEGLRWLASALQEDPAHRPTCQALADYYARQGDVEAAERFQRLAQQPPAGSPETLAGRHP